MKRVCRDQLDIYPKVLRSCIPPATNHCCGHTIRSSEPTHRQTGRPKLSLRPNRPRSRWSATVPAFVRLSIPFYKDLAATTLGNRGARRAVGSLPVSGCGRVHTNMHSSRTHTESCYQYSPTRLRHLRRDPQTGNRRRRACQLSELTTAHRYPTSRCE